MSNTVLPHEWRTTMAVDKDTEDTYTALMCIRCGNVVGRENPEDRGVPCGITQEELNALQAKAEFPDDFPGLRKPSDEETAGDA
jgi:hypothetical protein